MSKKKLLKKVEDLIEAVRIATTYIATKKGIVIFNREVTKASMNSVICSIDINNEQYKGTIVIDTQTGKVLSEKKSPKINDS